VVVSHDRYFLNRVADLLIVFEGEGQTRVVHGNYDTYERMRGLAASDQDSEQKPTKKESAAEAVTTRRQRRRFPYRKVEDLEADIATVELKVRELEELLASPELYRDGERVKEAMRVFEESKARLQGLYEH